MDTKKPRNKRINIELAPKIRRTLEERLQKSSQSELGRRETYTEIINTALNEYLKDLGA